MHRLGQADLRTTARYVHVLDKTGESAARRFEGLLPPTGPSAACRPTAALTDGGGGADMRREPADDRIRRRPARHQVLAAGCRA
jgi:hypothetical protein